MTDELVQLAKRHGSGTWLTPTIDGKPISTDGATFEPPHAMYAADLDGDGLVTREEAERAGARLHLRVAVPTRAPSGGLGWKTQWGTISIVIRGLPQPLHVVLLGIQ